MSGNARPDMTFLPFRHQGHPMPRLPLLVALLTGLAPPAFALDCKAAVNQLDLNECAGRDFKATDAKLR